MSRKSLSFLTALVLAATGCTSLSTLPCGPSEQAMVQELIYFGTDTPAGILSAEEWAGFLGSEVSPRFPAGYSVWPATGQWQMADRRDVREPSYVISILHADQPSANEAIRAITAAYKIRYAQEAVLRVRSPACASF